MSWVWKNPAKSLRLWGLAFERVDLSWIELFVESSPKAPGLIEIQSHGGSDAPLLRIDVAIFHTPLYT